MKGGGKSSFPLLFSVEGLEDGINEDEVRRISEDGCVCISAVDFCGAAALYAGRLLYAGRREISLFPERVHDLPAAVAVRRCPVRRLQMAQGAFSGGSPEGQDMGRAFRHGRLRDLFCTVFRAILCVQRL